MWWRIAVGIAAGPVLLWLLLVGLLLRAGRDEHDPARLRDALRLLPDLLVLLRRLAADPALPRGVRIRLTVVVLYLASPIDLIPDFIPLLGYADDAVVVLLGLRAVIRHAGPDALERHWPGTTSGLRTVRHLARI
ncbi:MAG TPA: DUF1232 domain-containing protein [Mycobacteriales bacterium]|nr:DUF1232 domain-containing protein [Mycobacteriales bacterium]